MEINSQENHKVKRLSTLYKKPCRNPPLLPVMELLASHEYRINHLPAFLVSVLGPEDRDNKTSPSGTHRQV